MKPRHIHNRRGVSPHLCLLLALVVLIGAAWLYVLLSTPPQRSLDQQAYEVASQLKCPICQGESVANSSSSRSEEMRGVIRQQLQEGRSEQDILRYFEQRYGSQILLAPPQQGFNLLAWLIPVTIFLLSIGLAVLVAREWQRHGRATERAQANENGPSDF